MKMLILTDVLFPDTIGGAGRVTYHLSREISKKGHTVNLITRNPENQFDPYQRVSEHFHIHRYSTPSSESVKLLLSEIQNSFNLAKQLGSNSTYDLICFHQCLAAIGPFFSGVFRHTPSVYIFHSPWHQEYVLKKGNRNGKCSVQTKAISSLMRWTENWMLSKCSQGFVLSNYMRNQLNSTHPQNNTPISILPGGVDLDHFHLSSAGKDSLKYELDLPLDKIIFLTVRNLVPRMGIENSIEAF